MIELGTDICERLDWRPGDTLEWIDNKDGTWTLRKTNE